MPDEPVRGWLVERTYSDDEQNLIILEVRDARGTAFVQERARTALAYRRGASDDRRGGGFLPTTSGQW